MNRLLSCALVAIALAAMQFQALAADEEKKPGEFDPAAIFDRLDTNKDGQVTADEAPEDQKRLFNRLQRTADKDGNGQLSRDEFVAGLANTRPDRAAEAAPGGGYDPGAMFDRIDANGDGKLVPDEIPEQRREQFRANLAKADKDQDGALTKEEFALGFRGIGGQGGRPMPGADRLLKAIDSNQDGSLSADELAAAGASLKKLDKDGDGALSRRELQAQDEQRPGQGGGRERGAEAMQRRLKEADKDGDGRISKEEAPERMKQNFEKLDANGDGFIDQADMQARQQGGEPKKDPSPDKAAKNKKKQAAKALAQQRKKPAKNANAKKDGQGMARRLQKADKDSDGKISKNEAPEKLKLRFARLDTNSDGFIDKKEFRSRDQQRKARMKGDRKKAEQKAA